MVATNSSWAKPWNKRSRRYKILQIADVIAFRAVATRSILHFSCRSLTGSVEVNEMAFKETAQQYPEVFSPRVAEVSINGAMFAHQGLKHDIKIWRLQCGYIKVTALVPTLHFVR